MTAQVSLLDKDSYKYYDTIETFSKPSFVKFYSLYKYDHIKFRELRKAWLKTEEGKNRTYTSLKKKQQEFLELCYDRDENNKPIKDSDEKHIFRTKTLQRLHSRIYEELGANPSTLQSFEVNGLIVYPDECQAELKDTWDMSIKDRVKVHIKVLRKLRGG